MKCRLRAVDQLLHDHRSIRLVLPRGPELLDVRIEPVRLIRVETHGDDAVAADGCPCRPRKPIRMGMAGGCGRTRGQAIAFGAHCVCRVMNSRIVASTSARSAFAM